MKTFTPYQGVLGPNQPEPDIVVAVIRVVVVAGRHAPIRQIIIDPGGATTPPFTMNPPFVRILMPKG